MSYPQALADLCRRHARAHSELVLEWAVVAAQAAEDGHSCVPVPADAASLLIDSGIAGDGTQVTPLVVADGHIYLHLLWSAEQEIAQRLRRLIRQPTQPVASVLTWFPEAGSRLDRQAIAAVAAARQRLTVVTGGPGTGKTTTAVRILALLLAQTPGLRIRLAAPTGKAAARLIESVRSGAARLPQPVAGIPATAETLHRMLGYNPGRDSFRGTPLAADVVVVDEASMVDLLLMRALLRALPEHCRLILLGDPGQLASVQTGHVLGGICAAAGDPLAVGDDLAAACACAGIRCPVQVRRPLGDLVVGLDAVHRTDRAELLALAAAVRAGSPVAAPLTDPGDARAIATRLEPHLSRVLEASSPAEALERLAERQVLAALRVGPWGTAAINRACDALCLRRGAHEGPGGWYRGRPLLVTENDARSGLRNGDLGVAWERAGIWTAEFPGLSLPLPALPGHEAAWAMTVHKCQGSEFGIVDLVLPDARTVRGLPEVITRELVYTGITRARLACTLLAQPEAWQAALAQATRRRSGLAQALLSR